MKFMYWIFNNQRTIHYAPHSCLEMLAPKLKQTALQGMYKTVSSQVVR